MKKLTWITALLIALALVITGCPGEGDDKKTPDTPPPSNGGENEPGSLAAIFTATKPVQDKATVVLEENTFTVMYRTGNDELWGEVVAPEETPWNASAYTGIKFEYKSTGMATIFIQDTNTIYTFGVNDSDGWGAVYSEEDWTELSLPFSITKYPDKNATDVWFGEKKPLNKSEIIKIAFQIKPAGAGEKFELRNFTAY